MKRGFVDIPEGQVHYRTEGNGEPLLLLHQTLMSSSDYALVIPILAQHYRVIAMDTLGYGDSARPPRQYRIPEYARSVINVIDALGINKLNLVGHLTGANIAGELTAQHPERVTKLVLSACPCFTAEEGQTWMKKYPPIEIKADGSHLKRVWQMAMERFPETTLDLAQAFTIDLLNTGLGERSEEGHVAAFTYDAASRLPLIKCPTLLLWGDKDNVYPYADRVRNQLPNAKVNIIKGGTDHYLRLLPREWAQAILDFFKES